MLDRYDQDLLLDYLEGELDADRRAQLEAQLADDPQLSQLLEAIAKDREALRSLPEQTAPADLVSDLTASLERRMLLDDSVDESGPIPMSRARGYEPERSGGVRWGRVAGLTGLAASVAVAAGLVVYSLNPDPLEQTAQRLADSSDADNEAGEAENAIAEAPGGQPAGDAGEAARATPGTTAEAQALSSTKPGTTISTQPPSEKSALMDLIQRAMGDRKSPNSREPEEWKKADERVASGSGLRGLKANELRTAEGGKLAEGDAPRTTLMPKRPVALAASPPRQQLVVFTDQPDSVREQLVLLCVDNGIPIVKADYDFNFKQGPGDDAAPAATEGVSDLATNDTQPKRAAPDGYALLINDTQLSQLLLDLNGLNSIEAKLALDPAELNQAAFVNTLSAKEADGTGSREAPADAQSADALSPSANPQAQAPIEVSLPEDLGSKYANDRNKTNFDIENRRNAYAAYDQLDDRIEKSATISDGVEPEIAADAAADTDTGALDAAEWDEGKPGKPLDEQLQNGQAEPTELQSEDKEDQAPATASRPDSKQAKGQNTPNDPADAEVFGKGSDESDAELGRDQPAALNPTRGNWLIPHLPLADTTLLLNWRRAQHAGPAQLVPIEIQTAPAEQVRNLRARQQADYGNREQPDSAKAAGDKVAADEADADAADAESGENELSKDAQPSEPEAK